MFEDLEGVISNQALVFGPTEKAARGNQLSIDGGRFSAFTNQVAFVLLDVSGVNGLGVKVLSGGLLEPTGKGSNVLAVGFDRVGTLPHPDQVFSVLVCNALLRDHRNIIL